MEKRENPLILETNVPNLYLITGSYRSTFKKLLITFAIQRSPDSMDFSVFDNTLHPDFLMPWDPKIASDSPSKEDRFTSLGRVGIHCLH